MRLLLEAGYFRFYTPEMHSCLTCFEAVFGDDTQRKIERGYKRLANDYFENTTVSLIEYSKRVCKFELQGPGPFYEHPMVMIYPGTKGRLREIVDAKPRVLRKLKDDGSVQLSRTVAKELGLHHKFASTVANSASFGILSSRILKTSFLTDNPLDISFLQALSNSPEIDARNQIAFKHLTSVVPFMEDTRLAGLLKLGKREEEAFITYRRALNEAIDEFKSSGSPFTEKQARELYSDKIAPRLAALDKSVKVAKRDLVKKGRDQSLLWLVLFLSGYIVALFQPNSRS